MHMFQALLLAGGDELELHLYGHIGEDMLFGGGIGPKMVAEELKKAPNAKLIKVRMSSPGGSVWDGMAIRSMLQSHPARVEMDVEGLAASVASVITTAADVVRMHAGGSYMMHNARGSTYGDAEQHKKTIERLEAINNTAAELYAARCGKTKAEILEKMAAETWFSPEEARSFGLVDEVVAARSGAPRMSVDLQRYGYLHVPPHVAALLTVGTDNPQPPRRTPNMSLTRIAMALGASDTADEAAVLSAIDRLKQQSQRRETLLVELRSIVKAGTDDELLGKARAVAEAAEQVPTLQAQLKTASDKADADKRAALIAADKADPKGRKLTPALEKLYADKPVAELEAYLKVAPVVLQMHDPKQRQVETNEDGTDGERPPQDELKWNGKTYAELKPFEKHNLFHENRQLFDAMSKQHGQGVA